MSFKAELRLCCIFSDTSKQVHGESASTAAASTPLTRNQGKAIYQLLNTGALHGGSAQFYLAERFLLIWPHRVAVAMFSGLQTTGSCDEPAQSFAGAGL